MINNKKKIIISNYDDRQNPIYAGGGTFAIHEVVKRLAKKYEVWVFAGNYKGTMNHTSDGVRYKYIGPRINGKYGQLIFHCVLIWHVLFEKYDLWIESFTPPFSTTCTPLFTNKPVIGLVHMLSARDMKRKYHIPFHIIENWGLTHYSHIITLTEGSAKDVKVYAKNADVVVIGNGVNIPKSFESLGDDHISFLGRIEFDQKGLDLLLEAYAIIKNVIQIPLHIAGTGSRKEMMLLEKRIKELGLGDSVVLRGRIEGLEKEDFLRKSSIGVVSSRFETHPLVVLEMMSFGIPIIMFDIPGLCWVPKDTVVKVPRFDTNILAEKFVELINDKKTRDLLSIKAREYAKKHDWNTVAERYKEYIDHVLPK